MIELYRMKKSFIGAWVIGAVLAVLVNSSFAAAKNKPVISDTAATDKLFYPELVNQFYQRNGSSLFWYAPVKDIYLLRQQLLDCIDSARAYHLIAAPYHYTELAALLNSTSTDTSATIQADRLYMDAAIAMSKDIYQGYPLKPWVGYDAVSAKYAAADNEYLLSRLLRVKNAAQLLQLVAQLEPTHTTYTALKQELRLQKEKKATAAVSSLAVTMNYIRWIHHFRFEQFIVVNLPAASLQYFENDKVVVQMKTVVGKPATPTPRFATTCDLVIMYPYWYVPGSILFKEYLPKIKANPSWIEAHDMQVVDGSGRLVNHHQLNWSSFHAGYFPYILRQSTGCDNALGILKFNINTPYGVYLHDTNNKTAFLSGSRFYSHGCIRLEDPLALGNRLLSGKLDTAFLQSCFKEQKPVPVQVKKPVPVFVVYMPVSADEKGKLYYYKDVYKLMKSNK